MEVDIRFYTGYIAIQLFRGTYLHEVPFYIYWLHVYLNTEVHGPFSERASWNSHVKCPYREVHGLIGDGLSLVGGSIPLIVLRTSMTS